MYSALIMQIINISLFHRTNIEHNWIKIRNISQVLKNWEKSKLCHCWNIYLGIKMTFNNSYVNLDLLAIVSSFLWSKSNQYRWQNICNRLDLAVKQTVKQTGFGWLMTKSANMHFKMNNYYLKFHYTRSYQISLLINEQLKNKWLMCTLCSHRSFYILFTFYKQRIRKNKKNLDTIWTTLLKRR